MAIPTILFDAGAIRLARLYQNPAAWQGPPVLASPKARDIYGPLAFPPPPPDRPVAYASYVMSVDGKIAFEDDEVGPLIAKNNRLDPDGATADFWMLNLLRACCDGIVIGAGTMTKEPAYSGSTYDPDLLAARQSAGMARAPWTVIVTRGGRGIPWQNQVFRCGDIPFVVVTSPDGLAGLLAEIPGGYYRLPRPGEPDSREKTAALVAANPGQTAVAVTGQGGDTDPSETMAVLRAMGMQRVLVESPSYCHALMGAGLLDEMFITTSCLFVGGSATGIGTMGQSFTSKHHPHCRVESIHMHSPHFLFTRYKMIYQEETNEQD